MPKASKTKSKASKTKATKSKVTKTKVTKAVSKTQKGGKAAAKAAAKAASKTTSKATTKAASKTTTKAASKTTTAKKVATAKVTATVTKKSTRSFKVKLPGTETYEGRFTGDTPYQAANKALSKYYRVNGADAEDVLFSIRESTRGSKRLVYHYNGSRSKLDVPVEYPITSASGEKKVITKYYKNRLVKVKKAQLKELNLA